MSCYGNSNLNKIHRTQNFGLSLARVWMDINLLCYVSVHCDFYFKLESVTIEKYDQATQVSEQYP